MPSWTEKFAELTAKNHKEQAIWWLNGFWEDGAQEEAEDIWELTHLAMEIETGVKVLYGKRKVEAAYGCDLDELKAHVFLEKLGETLTVRALRKRLSELDIDNNKCMALIEYMLAKYKKTPDQVVNAPGEGCGASKDELDAAQAQLDEAMAAMAAVQEALEQQEKAEQELRAAVAELEAQQKAFDDKKAGFQAKIDDESLSTMKRNMAKNELAQMNSEDPLPLRRAKITQGAALKRVEKAKKKTEEKLAEAEERVRACKEALDELKKRAGSPHGAIWWMERELSEAEKFMPRK